MKTISQFLFVLSVLYEYFSPEYIVKDLLSLFSSLLQTNYFWPTGGTVVTETKQETQVKNRAP